MADLLQQKEGELKYLGVTIFIEVVFLVITMILIGETYQIITGRETSQIQSGGETSQIEKGGKPVRYKEDGKLVK